MKRKTIFLMGVILFLTACGSGGGNNAVSENVDPSQVSNMSVLAKNVFIGTAEAAESAGVDTQTKVWAKNVVLDSVDGMLATDVQGAIEELAPNLADLIVGTWEVKCITIGWASQDMTEGTDSVDEDHLGEDPAVRDAVLNFDAEINDGEVTFNADGTYSVESVINSTYDPFLEKGLSAGVRDVRFKYRIINNKILQIYVESYTTSSCSGECEGYVPHEVKNVRVNAYPIVPASPDKIVLAGGSVTLVRK